MKGMKRSQASRRHRKESGSLVTPPTNRTTTLKPSPWERSNSFEAGEINLANHSRREPSHHQARHTRLEDTKTTRITIR